MTVADLYAQLAMQNTSITCNQNEYIDVKKENYAFNGNTQKT